jgi:hypothetical protein
MAKILTMLHHTADRITDLVIVPLAAFAEYVNDIDSAHAQKS